MRTISRRTQYGLKAILALGRLYGKGPVLIATLAAEETIPVKFLEGILLHLKSLGVLESRKGKGGGYQLSRPPSSITIGSIIRLLEGPLAPLPCVSETERKACEVCPDVKGCGIRMIMADVADLMATVLDRTSVLDLVQRVEDSKQASAGSG